MKKIMAEPKPTELKTSLQKALEFETKRDAIRQQAKEETITGIQEQLAQLAKLGFHYQLVEAGAPPKPAKPAPKKDGEPKPCSICGFITVPPHDGRAHRSQQSKAPFTEAELAALNLKKA